MRQGTGTGTSQSDRLPMKGKVSGTSEADTPVPLSTRSLHLSKENLLGLETQIPSVVGLSGPSDVSDKGFPHCGPTSRAKLRDCASHTVMQWSRDPTHA